MKKMIIFWGAFLLSTSCLLAEDGITTSNISIPKGGSVRMEIDMNNSQGYGGFQFDLRLPDGISATEIEKASRLVNIEGFTLSMNKTDDANNVYSILGYNSNRENIAGKSGAIAYITLQDGSDLDIGQELDADIEKIYLTDVDMELTEANDFTFTITIGEPDDGRIKFNETDEILPAYAAGEKGDITMARTIKAGEWSTLVLPFNLTRANATKAFGEDVQFATFSGFEVDYGDDEENVTPLAITVQFSSYTIPARGNLAGGTPVLIKTGKDISEIKLDDVTLVSTVTNVETADADYGFPGKFIGTFVKTTVPEDGLFLSGNKFWYSTGKTNIKAFRGWFELGAVLNKESDFGANLNFVIDGDPTSIDGIPGNMMVRKGDVYTIQGQYVGHDVDMKRLPSGIYIVDGKKMVVK